MITLYGSSKSYDRDRLDPRALGMGARLPVEWAEPMPEPAIVQVEQARVEDAAALPDIERAAGALFAGMPLPLEVFATATSVEDFADAARAGHLWVARVDGAIAGFALVELVDGEPHLEEMDVHPAHGRRGIGRRLLAAVQRWARASGHRGLTLTTFRNVAWNEPFYASAGFRALLPRELSPALRAVVDEEASRGLDPSTRVVMYWAIED